MRVALLGLALAAACATTALTALGPGAKLVRSKCGGCHLAPEPGRSRQDWSRVLGQHRERVPLDDAEREAIIAHLARPR